MTRKDFSSIAWSLRQTAINILGETNLDSDGRMYRQRQWDCDTLALADVCAASNGNFDRGRFLVAAGYTHHPDGSMFPMLPPR